LFGRQTVLPAAEME